MTLVVSITRSRTTGSRRVPPWRDEHVDDLAELVDRAIDVAPAAATFT
jgi:hypothetical protein